MKASATEPNRLHLLPTRRKDRTHVAQNGAAFPRPGCLSTRGADRTDPRLPEMARTFSEVDAVASAAGLASVSETVTGDHPPAA